MNTLYRPALWGLIAIAIVLGFVTERSGIEIGFNVLAVIVIWLALEIDKVRDASGRSLRERYAKVIKTIEEEEEAAERGEERKVVEPKHNPPSNSGAFGDNRQMFYDFAAFATKINDQLRSWSGWRVQEEATGDGVRNYSILFNGTKTGRLKLKARDKNYKTGESEISAWIDIWHARLFPYGLISSFLETIVCLISGDTRANYDRAMASVERSLTIYLWTAMRTPEGMPTLTTIIDGRPLAYFDRGELHEEAERFWAELGRPITPAASPSITPSLHQSSQRPDANPPSRGLTGG